MRANDIKSLNVSDAVRRLNPDLFGGDMAGLPKPVAKRHPRRVNAPQNADEKGGTAGAKGRRKPTVYIVGFRCRSLDDDNFRGGLKHLRDSISERIGLDDHETQINWVYSQVKVDLKSAEGTLVKIEI